jgi:hypothetical protein
MKNIESRRASILFSAKKMEKMTWHVPKSNQNWPKETKKWPKEKW